MRQGVKTGVICGSYGLLSQSLQEIDKMIKRKQVPPAFILLRRDGSSIKVDNKVVKFDLNKIPFRHEYFTPDVVIVIEGLFANYRDKGMHILTEEQIDRIGTMARHSTIDFVPASDVKNYRLNICDQAEDILINHTLEEFALKNLSMQIKREFANGLQAAMPEPDPTEALYFAMINNLVSNLTDEQLQALSLLEE